MTNKFQLHQNAISDLVTKRDYSGLYQLFTDHSFSFSDLILFYKRANKVKDKNAVPLFSQNEFWQSSIPHFYLDRILSSDLKISFYQSYFETGSTCNKELDLHLFSISPEDFIRFFKFWRPFAKENFWNSFSEITKGNSIAEKTKKELEIIKRELNAIETEEEKENQILLQSRLDDILLAFSLAYSEYKNHSSNFNNKALQLKIEIALVAEIDRIVKLLKLNKKITVDSFKFTDNADLQKEFKKYEVPHYILGKKGEHAPLPEHIKVLVHLIFKGVKRAERRGCVEIYLCGFSDFETTTLSPSSLISNKLFESFQINNAKSQPEEMFLSGFTLDAIEQISKQSRMEIRNDINVLEFYGLPMEIDLKGQKVDLKRVLSLLKHFSIYKGPEERTILLKERKYKVMNRGSQEFIQFFGSNESISVFDYESLISNLAKFLSWNESEAKETLNFICSDLLDGSLPHSWICSPFLQIGKKVIWMGSFLKDRRWDNILINKLKKERQFSGLVNSFSSAFEKQIEKSFAKAGFKVNNGLRFTTQDGQKGEIDVLAFKDNTLFIVEAKSGTRNDDFSHAIFAELVRLEGSAAEQLEKIKSYVKEDWKKIKSVLGIDSDVPLDQVTLMPLIVTDYFEGDLQLYKSSIRKITLLELEVILTNKRRELYEAYELMQRMNNSGNPNFNAEVSERKSWDLWEGNPEINSQQLITCIEQNLIWKDLERTWKFNEFKYTIG